MGLASSPRQLQKWAQVALEGFRLDIGKNSLTERLNPSQCWGHPGGVQKTSGCGTLGRGLVDVVGFDQRLDSVILEVLSNLCDSLRGDGSTKSMSCPCSPQQQLRCPARAGVAS